LINLGVVVVFLLSLGVNFYEIAIIGGDLTRFVNNGLMLGVTV
jgi:hypothetical protein